MPSKLIVAALGALAGLVLLLVWMQGGFHSKVPGGTTPAVERRSSAVRTVKAVTQSTSGEVTVSGTVQAREIARVASRILGYVIELPVDAGVSVKKGDLLVRIDSKEMAEREAQARAALESVKADLTKARNDYERFKTLYGKESIAKKDYDDALARLEIAQAAELKAQAVLDEASTMLGYGVVTSPFDGVVSERLVNVGDLATPGRPLVSVYIPGTAELVAAVGEQFSPHLREGAPVTVAVPSVDVRQSSAIREVVPQRDEKTRTITVKIPLEEAPGLGPGLYGTLTFATRASDVIVIPKHAIRTVGQLESVRVIEDGMVKIRHVKIGRELADDKVEVLSGLNPGEEVVAEK